MQTIIITSSDEIKDEAIVCNLLFKAGLKILHLRKPHADQTVYEKFIQQIAPHYRNRIVIHGHYELAHKYQLRGIHLRSSEIDAYIHYPDQLITISCHSLDEIRNLPFSPAYCFLSPIFDSLSKKGYSSHFNEMPDLSDIQTPVIALGGITPDKIPLCQRAGFEGVATLGYIWEKPEEAVKRFIRLKTPFVMSIAGLDPSAGAGLTADLKTFENTGSYGLTVCTALTFQNEKEYTGTHWVPFEEICQQCKVIFRTHQPAYVKIGLIENFEILGQLVDYLRQIRPHVKIIWDPILKASTGYVFHHQNAEKLSVLLDHLYLLTPNTEEVYQLFGSESTPTTLQTISLKHQVNILWKGGHNEGAVSTDLLITPDQIYSFSVQKSEYGKHGTGCVVSAALTSALAQNYSLSEACCKAQIYVSQFINSNDSQLGYHSIASASCSNKPSPQELSLQYITAPKAGMSLNKQIEAVCQGGVRWVQLRMKGTSVAEMIQEGQIAQEICKRYNTLFIINDNVEVARQLNADGVHLGKEDMDPIKARTLLGPGKIIGATCNTWDDILLRQKQQVDYIGLGPFTYTTTKEKLSPVLGVEGYHQLLKQMQENNITIPVFAIGGITERDIPVLMRSGVQGIALSGLIKNSDNLSHKTAQILTLLNNTTHLKS